MQQNEFYRLRACYYKILVCNDKDFYKICKNQGKKLSNGCS